MTGSAKQSIAPRKEQMDCFVASAFARRRASADKRAPRNDEWRHSFAISPHVFAQGIRLFPALSNQRAQGRPGARCTRGLVCNVHKGVRTRAYRFSGEHPAFPAQWFTAYSALSPVTGFLATVIPEKLASQKLDASIGASGPHDFAVRISAVRRRHIRVHRIPPHVS